MQETKTVVKHNSLQQRLNDIRENPHLIPFYSSPKCRDCHGRGVRITSVCRGSNDWVEQKTVCHCVRKAIAKETRELEHTEECTNG